jgi:hypothetical protein
MSAAEKAVDTAKEVVAEAADEVSEKAEQFAEYARRLNRAKAQFYLLGMAVGGLTGAVVTYKLVYAKAETKYSKIADDEIAEMGEHYRAKSRALDAEAAKRPVEEIVRDRGYASPEPPQGDKPPMAVPPPRGVTENESASPEKPEVRNIFTEQETQAIPEWDWHTEKKRRSPDIPYVIHYDERFDTEGYADVTLTYYDGDDVLCNERDEIIDPYGIVGRRLFGSVWSRFQ